LRSKVLDRGYRDIFCDIGLSVPCERALSAAVSLTAWRASETRAAARAAMAASRGEEEVSFWGLAQLGMSTVIFLLAAMAAKQWGLEPSLGKILLTLALYTAGNLIMLRLVREFGMSVSFSLSAVIQLVSVNVVALVFFGERLNAVQATGVVLAIGAVALITLGPYMQRL
jgi:drug/metabolite transporter (DMT)-like permease